MIERMEFVEWRSVRLAVAAVVVALFLAPLMVEAILMML